MSSRREGRSNLLAVLLLALLPTLFFADVLLGFGNFAMRDLLRYYYPTKQIYRQIVAGGEFPLWNPFFHGGQPLAANPEHEIFYPFTWLLLLPDFDLGYRLHILLHVYVALFGMYALLRSMRLAAPAAAFGAISFGLGGLVLSYVNLLPILFCAAWLPVTLLFTRRFLIFRRWADFALAALFLGLQFLVAEPTTLVQTGLLLGIYGLYRGWCDAAVGRSRVTAAVRATGRIALVSVAGFAVGAVQMLAAIDHAGDSVRSRPFRFDLVGTWSMPWAKLAEIVYPSVLGHAGLDAPYWAASLYEPRSTPFLLSIYAGLGVAAFAAAAVVARVRGSGLVLAVLALSVVLAAGRHTPLLRLLYDAGIAASIRYPEKFLLLGMLPLIVLAAKAFDRALRGCERTRRTAAAFALASATIAAGITLLGFTPLSIDAWASVFGLPRDERTLAMIGVAWTGWAVAVGRGLALFLLLIAMRAVRRPLWLALALLFLCADLGPVVHELNPRLPAAYFRTAPLPEQVFPPNRSSYRLFHEAEWFPHSEANRRFFSHGLDDYAVLRNAMLPPWPAAWGIRTVLERDFDETALLQTRDFTTAAWEIRRKGPPESWRTLMAMSNVRYRAVFNDFEEEWRRTGGNAAELMPVAFVEGPPHPRYYFSDEIVPIENREQFVAELSARPFGDRVAFVRHRAFVPASGEILGVRERSSRVELDVIAHGNAFLVMSVTAHKYWRVTMDGRSVQPVVTNLAYQGVVVPPGRHRIAMRYRNRMIEIGAPITIGAIALLLVPLLAGRRRTPVAPE